MFLVPMVNNTGGESDICLLKGLVAFFPGIRCEENFGVVLFLLTGQWFQTVTELLNSLTYKRE